LTVMAQYTNGGDKLHMAYTFNLLGDELDGTYIRQVVETVEANIENGWPCWSIGNHDAPRVVSRVGGGGAPPELANVLLAMMLSLRGSACIYQGEELGLVEADIPFERLQDPYGIAFWPEFKGRDGCRTPMPWDAQAPHGGFSSVEPWLPVAAQHLPYAAGLQACQANSVLTGARRFLHWRREQPLLMKGAIRFYDAPPHCVLFSRSHEGSTMLAAFNLSGLPCKLASPLGGPLTPIQGHGMGGKFSGETLVLPAYGAWFGLAA
jgi:alpha-glucosidase